MTEPTADVPKLARLLPKVELHAHLEGSVRPATVVELARKNGVTLPADDPTALYDFADLNGFLAVYGVICASLCTVDDFRRITYEALQDASAHGVRYREMFFSPTFVMNYGVALDTIWEGIRLGLADAHADLDIRCRMILDIDKGSDPALAVELARFAAAQDREVLIGMGGDSTERGIDHRTFKPAYDVARDAGLRLTMHAGEDGPAENIRVSLEVLGAERIDHGVRLADDPELLRRVVDEGIALTVCPLSNVLIARIVPDVAHHPFGALHAAGVKVTINSDDPGMTATTIADDYEHVAAGFGYDLTTMAGFAYAAIDASWAPDDEKRALRARFADEIAALA